MAACSASYRRIWLRKLRGCHGFWLRGGGGAGRGRGRGLAAGKRGRPAGWAGGVTGAAAPRLSRNPYRASETGAPRGQGMVPAAREPGLPARGPAQQGANAHLRNWWLQLPLFSACPISPFSAASLARLRSALMPGLGGAGGGGVDFAAGRRTATRTAAAAAAAARPGRRAPVQPPSTNPPRPRPLGDSTWRPLSRRSWLVSGDTSICMAVLFRIETTLYTPALRYHLVSRRGAARTRRSTPQLPRARLRAAVRPRAALWSGRGVDHASGQMRPPAGPLTLCPTRQTGRTGLAFCHAHPLPRPKGEKRPGPSAWRWHGIAPAPHAAPLVGAWGATTRVGATNGATARRQRLPCECCGLSVPSITPIGPHYWSTLCYGAPLRIERLRRHLEPRSDTASASRPVP
jgi:hypothetical protein